MLWRISVATTPESEEAISELLATTLAQPVSSYTDAETRATRVSVYLRHKASWSRAQRAALALGLKRIGASGLNIGSGRVRLRRIGREDWAESWKRHFRPLAFGSALLLKPGWSRRRARKGQAVVVLDPGLSFGTGHHPTTAFCLRQLVARRLPGQAQSVLDVGTGSGILAIAAAKLGYAPVHAFDCDPESIRVARANARRNHASARIRFRHQDLTRLSRRGERQYSLICANLVSRLLVDHQPRLLARLSADGVLVAAGILAAEFGQVQQALGQAGLRLLVGRTEGGWHSGAFGWR